MLTLVPRERGIFTRVGSRPFRFRRTTISTPWCGMSNAMRCVPIWSTRRKRGVGAVCGDAVAQRPRNRNYCRTGHSLNRLTGRIMCMRRSRKQRSTPCARPSAGAARSAHPRGKSARPIGSVWPGLSRHGAARGKRARRHNRPISEFSRIPLRVSLAMTESTSGNLYVKLSASEIRRRLKGHSFGVRRIETAGRGRAVIVHTAMGKHLRQTASVISRFGRVDI